MRPNGFDRTPRRLLNGRRYIWEGIRAPSCGPAPGLTLAATPHGLRAAVPESRRVSGPLPSRLPAAAAAPPPAAPPPPQCPQQAEAQARGRRRAQRQPQRQAAGPGPRHAARTTAGGARMTSLRWSRGALYVITSRRRARSRDGGAAPTAPRVVHPVAPSLAPIPASTLHFYLRVKLYPRLYLHVYLDLHLYNATPVPPAASPPTQSLQPQLASNKSWCHQPARPFPTDADISGDKHRNAGCAAHDVGMEAGS